MAVFVFVFVFFAFFFKTGQITIIMLIQREQQKSLFLNIAKRIPN
jgi:hypothetical protein